MGIDLISLDLVRGRDFGEPSYNSFRQLCGLNKAQTFDDLADQMNKKVMINCIILWKSFIVFKRIQKQYRYFYFYFTNAS